MNRLTSRRREEASVKRTYYGLTNKQHEAHGTRSPLRNHHPLTSPEGLGCRFSFCVPFVWPEN